MGGSLQERCNDAGLLAMNYEYKILRYLTRSAQLIAVLIRHFRSRIRFTIGRVSLRIPSLRTASQWPPQSISAQCWYCWETDELSSMSRRRA